MQVFDAVDPLMIMFYGLAITLIVLLYASRIRQTRVLGAKPDSVSNMIGGRVDEITTGAVQIPMLDHLVSIQEERLEQEGCKLGDPVC